MAATLSDYILDNGLNALQAATHIYVTVAEQTTYAAVVNVANDAAHNLSPREYAEAPTARSPNGSKVHTLSTTIGGNIYPSVEAHFWYFTDDINARLLARGAIAGSVLYVFYDAGGGTPRHFPAYIPPGDNVQIPSVGTNCIVDPWVLNNGLEGLKAQADKIYICSAMPTTYAEATATFALGNKDMGAGGVFSGNSITAGTAPVGRQIGSNALTLGNVTTTGTASHVGIVDSGNSQFLVGSAVAFSPVAVTSGAHFSLGVMTVKLVSS